MKSRFDKKIFNDCPLYNLSLINHCIENGWTLVRLDYVKNGKRIKEGYSSDKVRMTFTKYNHEKVIKAIKNK